MGKKRVFFQFLGFLALPSSMLFGLENLNILRDFKEDLHREFLLSRRQMIDDLIEALDEEISYYAALSETADWRHQLANLQKSQPEMSFGRLRQEGACSNLAIAGAKDHIEKIDLILKKSKRRENHPFFDQADYYYEYQMFGRIQEKKIPITTVLYLDHDNYKKERYLNKVMDDWFTVKRYDNLPEKPKFYYYVIHTEPEYLEEINDHLNTIWDKVLYEKNREDKISLIAQFHWWFSNAMPFERGSAAIGEVLTEALLKGTGHKWEKKKHLLIDIEALLEPCMEEFVRKYPTYYDKFV